MFDTVLEYDCFWLKITARKFYFQNMNCEEVYIVKKKQFQPFRNINFSDFFCWVQFAILNRKKERQKWTSTFLLKHVVIS